MRRQTVVIGTRGSALAMWQAEHVKAALERAVPARRFVLKKVETRGDIDRSVSLAEIGTRGIFVKEIESALLSGDIDLGVHSLKDLPSELHPELTLAAFGSREDPRDVLISREGISLAILPPGARVGTSSPRRAAQVKALRRDLVTDSIRGNVDTRIRKVLSGEYDATVLAAAGLHRLGLQEHIVEYFSLSTVLPAPCQGIIGVEARATDEEILEMARRIDDRAAHIAAEAERAFVRALGGGCTTPLGAYAVIDGSELLLRAMLALPDGGRLLRDEGRGDPAHPEKVGELLAQRMLAAGGSEILGHIDHGGPGEA